jgi:5-formyltetrahydrofolate cyclo-ligase
MHHQQPTTPKAEIASQKSAMRRAILQQRDALAAHQRAHETQRVLALLLALPEYISASTILFTMNFGSEIETRGVIVHALSQQKRVALPRVSDDRQTLALFWVDPTINLEAQLVRSAWGIAEPMQSASAAPIAAIDFVLLPGVAFDREGNRLGFGRGYYDRLLAQTRAETKRVAIAFECQVVSLVPATLHDERLDILLTCAGVNHFSR